MEHTVLDQATTRAEAVRAQRQTDHAAAVESVLDEIGRPVYARAKARLPKIEAAIQQSHRPQLARLASVALTSGLALPQQARQWQAELTKICDEVPHQLRTALTDF